MPAEDTLPKQRTTAERTAYIDGLAAGEAIAEKHGVKEIGRTVRLLRLVEEAKAEARGPAVHEPGVRRTWELFIPERDSRPFQAVLDRPERLFVAWHRDADGIHELLDGEGCNALGHPPDARLWEVREYRRVFAYACSAYYERAG